MLRNARFNTFPLSLIILAVLKITTPSGKLQYLATNHRVVETLIANGLSSLSVIRVIGNRYLKVISPIANLSLPSDLTLGRKYNPAYGSIGLFICWKDWNLLWTHNLCLGVYHKPLLKEIFFFSLKIKIKKKKEIFCSYFPCSLKFQKMMYLENTSDITPRTFALFCRGRKLP